MLPRLFALASLLITLLAPAVAADGGPLTAVLPAESTTAGQRRTAVLKLAREAAGQLEKDKPATAGQEDLLFVEAIDDYQRLIEEAGDKLLPLDPTGRRHCVQARWLCTLDLTRLPAPALRVYRNRVDAQARKWFDRGAADHDVSLLRRVVDEAFCSSHGDRALDLLGDLAFEAGRFDEAERWWRQIARPASEANRKPAADDFELVYPDPKVDVARVRAKQVLARLFAGTPPERLAREVEAFRTLHPKAEGSLAGRSGNYADTLRAMLERPAVSAPDSLNWPTFAGDPSRNRILPPHPEDPNRLRRLLRDGETHRFSLETHARLRVRPDLGPLGGEPVPPQLTAKSLAFHPVIAGTSVLVADAQGVTAHDAVTGQTATWELTDDRHKVPRTVQTKLPAEADLRYTLTVADGKVYARLGAQKISPDLRADEADSFLVCLDLPLGKHARWHARAQIADSDPLTIFEGAPVVADGRVCIAATRFVNNQVITSVRCYPAQGHISPPVRWQQDVCSTLELKQGESRYRHHLLTLAGPNIVYCSHSGAIVALDARTGRPAWAVRYPTRGVKLGEDETSPRDLVPCVYAAGRLYAAPADHDRLMCLDPATGATLWERRIEAVHLLGVSLGRLVLTTPGGIRAIDAATGLDHGGWVQPAVGGALQPSLGEGLGTAKDDGLPSFGRGFLAGDLVFWPTRRLPGEFDRGPPGKLWVLSVKDGEQPDDLTDDLGKLPPGNVVLGDGILAVAGTEMLSIFTSPARLKPKREGAVRQEPDSARALYDLGATRADTGDYPAALREFKLAERAANGDFHFAEEARQRQREVLREQAAALRAERRWDEADAALIAAAKEGDSRQRQARLAERAALWEEAGQPAKAVALWQSSPDERAPVRITELIQRHGRGIYAEVEREAAGVRSGNRTADLKTLVVRFPNSSAAASALLELARLHAKAGQEGLAAHHYRVLIHDHRDSPERPVALVELARHYERQGLWGPARVAWERLRDEHGTQTVPAIAPGREVREWVAEQMRRTEYAQPVMAELPMLAPPLTRSWQARLPPGERLLPAEPNGHEIFFADGNRLVCRDAMTGETRWERSLAVSIHWAGRHADTVLAGGPFGVHCLSVDDGTLLWRQDRARGELSSFRLAAGRLFYLEGDRHLWAVDAGVGRLLWKRSAPGWSLGGRFCSHTPAGEEHLLAQTAGGRLWVLDARTGATRHDLETAQQPWPRPPLLLDSRYAAVVVDARTVVLFDPATGKEVSRPSAGKDSTKSGVAPLLATGGGELVVLQLRNYGSTLECFDSRTGAARWEVERLVSRDPPEDVAVDGGAVYAVCGSVLSALALRDGRLLWRVPLGESAKGWRLLPCRDALVACPSDVGLRRTAFRWLPGTVSLTFRRRAEPEVPVLILDPETGNLIQRLNLPVERARAASTAAARGLQPSVSVERVAPVVQVWRGGLTAGADGAAWGRTATRE